MTSENSSKRRCHGLKKILSRNDEDDDAYPYPEPEQQHLQDPLMFLGVDLFLGLVLPLLDASSIASCVCVSRSWRASATADALWSPLLDSFLASRAHLPLSLLRRSSCHSHDDGDRTKQSIVDSPYNLFSAIAIDAKKKTLTAVEMCARIWELKVKPTCGPYWYSLDPTSQGKDPLLRRFHCDYSITALREDDPIWGGQECVWQFVKPKEKSGKVTGKAIQINKWPLHHIYRLPDGRWCLDNIFACYTTCPDRIENMPAYLKGKLVKHCPQCNPEPTSAKQITNQTVNNNS